ncbi:hypothetical protein TRIP_C20559 [Candidatus Zixiibacteriota bacterium]|nr:hypothetical protein TRIP_C20559 [candidate division Zixibacteria bacterium]
MLTILYNNYRLYGGGDLLKKAVNKSQKSLILQTQHFGVRSSTFYKKFNSLLQ